MKDIPAKSKESPALKFQSEHYPESWNGRVPLKVRMIRTVRSDIPASVLRALGHSPVSPAIESTEYYVWVNRHGAISAVMGDGAHDCLGLKPGEFEIIEWWPEDGADG